MASTSVSVTPGTAHWVDVAALPADAELGTLTYAWSVPGIASISLDDTVEGRFLVSYVAPGSTTLTVTDPRSGVSAALDITTVPPPPPLATSLTLTVEA